MGDTATGSLDPSALLVELIRLNAKCAESFQAFFQTRSEVVARLNELDEQFIALAIASQYQGVDKWQVDHEVRQVAGDLAFKLSNDDFKKKLAELAKCFALKVNSLSQLCK